MIACFLSNISAKYYKNPSVLSRFIAKNVWDVILDTVYYYWAKCMAKRLTVCAASLVTYLLTCFGKKIHNVYHTYKIIKTSLSAAAS